MNKLLWHCIGIQNCEFRDVDAINKFVDEVRKNDYGKNIVFKEADGEAYRNVSITYKTGEEDKFEHILNLLMQFAIYKRYRIEIYISIPKNVSPEILDTYIKRLTACKITATIHGNEPYRNILFSQETSINTTSLLSLIAYYKQRIITA